MQEPAHMIAMEEGCARRIILAQAVESADAQGRLVSEVERKQIDLQARNAARTGEEGPGGAGIGLFLQTRAALLLQTLAGRDRALASLQDRSAAERWFTAAIPVGALVLGIFTDQVANPHQVNLLSKPLLLLLLWNAVVYLLLLASAVTTRPKGRQPPRFAALRAWLAGVRDWRRRPGQLRGEVTASFLMQWHVLTAKLYGQRLARVMHLAAAAWALGVALSLFFGGVWASYGVHWESTFLSTTDVHRFLSVLFAPVTAIFPWASFSLEEVRSLRAVGPMPAPSDAMDNFTGRRWVFLYTVLLAQCIVLPRLVLAALAWWRERSLARCVRLDLDAPYYQRLIASISPTQVQLCLYAHRGEDRAALLRVLVHRAADALPGWSLGQGQVHALLEGSGGEVLRMLDLHDVSEASLLLAKNGARSPGWSGRLLDLVFGKAPAPVAPEEGALRAARKDSDVVLHVVASAADLDAAAGVLELLDKPVLVLVNSGVAAPTPDPLRTRCETYLRPGSPVAAVLDFDQFARCWIQEGVLLNAVGRCLPAYKAAGFARLAAAWDQRNLSHLRASMAIVASHLLAAAREAEDVGNAPRSLASLVRPGQREAHEQRSREAMATVVGRLQRSEAQATAGLLVLHGIAPSSAGVLNHRLEQKFVVQDAISAAQAGMAGAATGAAMGVSIDLLTAGLTLGLAAAAGAVVGGGAAWVAAVWKNQATPAGTSVVQLSDEMLQAMAEAAMLRYVAVVHFGRGRSGVAEGEIRPAWRSAVIAAVERRSQDLKQQWSAVRTRQEGLEPTAVLVAMLESIALDVLNQLYPATATTTGTAPAPA